MEGEIDGGGRETGEGRARSHFVKRESAGGAMNLGVAWVRLRRNTWRGSEDGRETYCLKRTVLGHLAVAGSCKYDPLRVLLKRGSRNLSLRNIAQQAAPLCRLKSADFERSGPLHVLQQRS